MWQKAEVSCTRMLVPKALIDFSFQTSKYRFITLRYYSLSKSFRTSLLALRFFTVQQMLYIINSKFDLSLPRAM